MHTSARTTLRLSLLSLLAAGLFVACSDMGAWDLIRREAESPIFAASMEITVDASAVSEFMIDVPVLVRLAEPGFDYSVSRRAGRDIGFYPEPFELGMEPLDHALAWWDPSGASFFWVRIPLITPGSTVTLHMHAGSETVEVPENPEGVWRNGYAAVLGFDNTSDRYADASRFGNHGEVNVNGQTEPAAVSGVIGSGIEMVRSTDAVLIPDSETVRSLTQFTLSAWVRVPPDFSSGRVFGKSQRFLFAKLRSSGTEWEFQSRIQHTTAPPGDDGPSNDVFNAWVGPAPSPSAWTHLALRWNGDPNSNRLTLSIDGAAATAFNPNGSAAGDLVPDTGSPLAIGNSAGFGAGARFDGQIDHVEISFVARSLSWIQFHVATVRQTNMSYGPLQRR